MSCTIRTHRPSLPRRRVLALLMLGGLWLLVGAAADPGAAEESATLPKALVGGRERSSKVLVALHGGTRSFRSPAERARDLLNELDDAGRRAGVRVVVPVLPDAARGWRGETSGPHGVMHHDGSVPWASPPGEAALHALLDRLVEKQRADPERLGLAGHGAGGTAALLLAARAPERFCGVVLWSASPAPLWDEQRRVVGLVEEPAERLAGLGLYAWTGDQDEILDRDALRLLLSGVARAVERDGGRAPIHEHGEGGHGFGERGARRGLAAFATWRGHGAARGGGRERR